MAYHPKTITIRFQVTPAFHDALKEFVARRRKQGKPSTVSGELRAAAHNYMVKNDPDLPTYANYEMEDLA